MTRLPAAILPLVGLLAACGAASAPAAAAPATARQGELIVFAAASLRDAAEEAAHAYEAATPGTAITLSTDSSSALATQIEQGAPADVFLAADTNNPAKLADAGLAIGEPVAFAGNELALIVPLGNPASIRAAQDLANDGVRIVAAGDSVPITRYVSVFVDNVAQTSFGPTFVESYAANVVSKEDNVRAVLAKIELGEGDAAIVYATDAMASKQVETVAIRPDLNVVAVYAGVVVRTSSDPDAARAFLAWFTGPRGQEILAGFGFKPVR